MNCFFCQGPGQLVEPFSNCIKCSACGQGKAIKVATVYHNDMTVLYASIGLHDRYLQIVVYPSRNETTIKKMGGSQEQIILNMVPTNVKDFLDKVDTYILFS